MKDSRVFRFLAAAPFSACRAGLVALAAICLPVMAGDPPQGGGQVDPIAPGSGSSPPALDGDAELARLAALDVYWAEVSRSVNTGDFEAYAATCHPEGVLVSGSKRMSQPLADALARWEKDFIATREGKVLAAVEFRFSQRLGDASTAHESGIFRYTSHAPDAEPKHEWIGFEGLLVKRGDTWKILMEYQIEPVTEAEWDALK